MAGTLRMRTMSTFGFLETSAERVLELLRRAEEERAVDLVHLDPWRDLRGDRWRPESSRLGRSASWNSP